MPFTLPELPYDKAALEPYISSKTLDFHHGKHHKAYVDKANDLVKGTHLENMPLEQAVIEARREGVSPLFNNIGQIYNHNMFWLSIAPDGEGGASPALLEKIAEAFGDFDSFKSQFISMGVSQFGSGWVWLVSNRGALEIVKTPNAETPLTEGKTPLLVCDVWEHAYYLDYQNRRADFLEAFVAKLANWEYAMRNCEEADRMLGTFGSSCGGCMCC